MTKVVPLFCFDLSTFWPLFVDEMSIFSLPVHKNAHFCGQQRLV